MAERRSAQRRQGRRHAARKRERDGAEPLQGGDRHRLQSRDLSPDLEQPATSLAAHGGTATPAASFETLAAVTDAWLSRWAEGVAFQTVRRAWLDRAGPTGRPLRVRLHGEEAEGTYAGLDSGGALRLLMSDGAERRIAAGDVFFATS